MLFKAYIPFPGLSKGFGQEEQRPRERLSERAAFRRAARLDDALLPQTGC